MRSTNCSLTSDEDKGAGDTCVENQAVWSAWNACQERTSCSTPLIVTDDTYQEL